MGIIQWLFDLARLAIKNMFRVSEGTIEQCDGKGLLKIAPLTSNTCLPTNCSVESQHLLNKSVSRVSKGTIRQHNNRGLLKVFPLTLNRGSISKLFSYVRTFSTPSEHTGKANKHLNQQIKLITCCFKWC